jgi:hypothetical protein
MNTVTFNFKLDVGDACYAIIKYKVMKCRVCEVWINYKKRQDERLCIEYCLVDKSGCPSGVFPENEVFATKEELIRHIESS